MNRNLISSIFIFALAQGLLSIPAQAGYTLRFSSGRIPDGVTVANENGLRPNAEGYRRGYTLDGWTVDRCERGYVALSPTYTRSVGDDGQVLPFSASCNVMTLPELTVGEGEWLRWNAMSVHPDFPDSYRVEIAVGDGPRNLLKEYVDENSRWTTRLIDLSGYAGKSVHISFVACSVNRYMLALDDIFVGVPDEFGLSAVNETPVYYGSSAVGNAPVTFSVMNNGTALSEGKIVCLADYEVVREIPLEQTWKTGEVREFSYGTPAQLNKRMPYEVAFEHADGSRESLFESILYCSAFPRALMVDKGTGMWCANCPSGNIVIEDLERTYGDALIPVESHNSDPFANEDYINDLGFHSIPYMTLNRIRNSASSNSQLFFNFIYKPVTARVDITDIKKVSDDEISVSASVMTSEAFDNSADRYRLGYVLTADFYDPESKRFYQRNGTNQVTARQYYFLPSTVPPPLARFHNVSLTHETAFSGMAGSLPAEVEPGKAYAHTRSVTRPDLLDDIEKGRLVVFFLDTETGEALNSVALPVDTDFTGVEDVVSDNTAAQMHMSLSSGGEVSLSFSSPSDYTLEVFDISGQRCGSVSGRSATSARHSFALTDGLYLFRLSSAGSVIVRKVVVK